MNRTFVLLLLALCLGSCSFSREIHVVWRNGQLAIDFPWSFWRVIGRQEREYPSVDSVELYDEKQLLWRLDAATATGNGTDAAMPIILGKAKHGFIAKGKFRLRPGRYGVGVGSYATARVDFILHPDGSVESITDWEEQMEAPCGTFFGPACARGEKQSVTE